MSQLVIDRSHLKEIKLFFIFQCTVPGCSYAASEPLVRMHHQTVIISKSLF